jgi:hypothetical protein
MQMRRRSVESSQEARFRVDKGSKRKALIDSLKDISSEKMDEMLGSREVDHEAMTGVIGHGVGWTNNFLLDGW